VAEDELHEIVETLIAADADLAADVRLLLARPPYAIDPSHPWPLSLLDACVASGCAAQPVGLSFWTDAAILGARGVSTVLFGPGGAGLHSPEEYVRTDDVIRCRDVLVRVAGAWCGAG
jgi:acetylornithine deacetylase